MEEKLSPELIALKEATDLFRVKGIAKACRIERSVVYYVFDGLRRSGGSRPRLEEFARFMNVEAILARADEWAKLMDAAPPVPKSKLDKEVRGILSRPKNYLDNPQGNECIADS